MSERKILIVDDEPNIVMSLEYAFKKKEFQVFVARDGTEALEIAEAHKPDIILLDIMMPQMDGYETLRQVRKNKDLDHTKVIFLSAKSTMTDIKKGMEIGAERYITKPFSVKKILSEVEDMISKKNN